SVQNPLAALISTPHRTHGLVAGAAGARFSGAAAMACEP
ncbi:MAG: hypothetical protein QOE44_1987, partial [Solirubrobacteraceae bacterium]|nr:hypothetical protein [Solirubrobacteraceae bacterium]